MTPYSAKKPVVAPPQPMRAEAKAKERATKARKRGLGGQAFPIRAVRSV